MKSDTIIVLLDDAEYDRVILENTRRLYETHHFRPGDHLAERLRKLRNDLWKLA